MGKHKVVLIDPYDSFVYVIMQYIGQLGCDPVVLRSSADNREKIKQIKPEFIVLGPGPGTPEASGHVELIHEFQDVYPMLGVCLGLQALAIAYGATVSPAEHIMHGKTSLVSHDGSGMFLGLENPTVVTRYHSLVAHDEGLPAELIVTARSQDDNYIMGLRHARYPIEAVQFHPESIGTDSGQKYIANFIRTYLPQLELQPHTQ